MPNIIELAETVKNIREFIEGGELASILADIGLHAAVEALDKMDKARNKSAQVWSAINHLESADAALDNEISRQYKLTRLARFSKLEILIKKRYLILALMAICYAYLNEKELSIRTLQKAHSVRYIYDGIGNWSGALIAAANVFNPLTYWDRISANIKDPHLNF